MSKHLSARFEEIGRNFLETAQSSYPGEVARAADMIGRCFEDGGKLLVFGNGGSAADSQHFVGELVVRFQTTRKALPAIALVTDSVVLTACANDVAFETVFARQIEALGRTGDVAFAISTSGNSPNIIAGLRAARACGMQTVLLTGSSASAAIPLADMVLAAAGANTARIQEIHLATYHLICELLDTRFTA